MEEPIDTVQTVFHIYPNHLKWLEKVNKNRSQALRTVLNSIIRGDRFRSRKQMLDEIVKYTAWGFICYFISFLMSNPMSRFSIVCLGSFLVGYGLLGGVFDALQRRKLR